MAAEIEQKPGKPGDFAQVLCDFQGFIGELRNKMASQSAPPGDR